MGKIKKQESSYTGSSIQILEGLEAVRKRPAMYIGEISEKGLHHLVNESIDDSISEAMAGYCTDIEVTISKDNSISVVDNSLIDEQQEPQNDYSMKDMVSFNVERLSKQLSGMSKRMEAIDEIESALHPPIGTKGAMCQALSAISKMRTIIKETTDKVRNNTKELKDIVKHTLVKVEEKLAKDGRRIGGRVNNHRPEVEAMCDKLNDDKFVTILQECHLHIFGYAIEYSRKLSKFLITFCYAFFKKYKEKIDKYDSWSGKLTHLYHIVEERLGKLKNCGIRTIEKGMAWFSSFSGKSSKENDEWAKYEEEKFKNWSSLAEGIKEYLIPCFAN